MSYLYGLRLKMDLSRFLYNKPDFDNNEYLCGQH